MIFSESHYLRPSALHAQGVRLTYRSERGGHDLKPVEAGAHCSRPRRIRLRRADEDQLDTVADGLNAEPRDRRLKSPKGAHRAEDD